MAVIEQYLGFFELLLLALSLLLLVASRPLLSRIYGEQFDGSVLHIFRAANLLLFSAVLFNAFVPALASHSWWSRLLATLMVLYLAYLLAHVLNYVIKRRFGKPREVDGRKVLAETYRTRMLSLLSTVITAVLALLIIIRMLGFEGLLEAGGVLGVIGVMLALTQGSWAPDIISGLVILNGRLLEEGDVIEFDASGHIIGIVYKTKFFHTEILSLVSNNRILISNARLRAATISNLSRFASAKGLRDSLSFKVGYEVEEKRITAMVADAFAALAERGEIKLEQQHEPQLRALEAGDNAVLWSVYYYTKDIRNLLAIRQALLQMLLQAARAADIQLATPVLHRAVTA